MLSNISIVVNELVCNRLSRCSFTLKGVPLTFSPYRKSGTIRLKMFGKTEKHFFLLSRIEQFLCLKQKETVKFKGYTFGLVNNLKPLFSAVSSVLSVSLGSFVGGVMTRRLKMTPLTTIKMLLLFYAIYTASLAAGFFLGCKQPELVGDNGNRYVIFECPPSRSCKKSNLCY